MIRKARHESEIFKIRKEMAEAETLHKAKISEIERKLLEARLKSQREADAKVHNMQNAAHEKAAEYLATHLDKLKQENASMDLESRRLIMLTEDKLMRKEWLERTNRELQQELKIREDVVGIRLEKIMMAQHVANHTDNESKKQRVAKKRLEMIAMLLKTGIIQKGMATLLMNGPKSGDGFEGDAPLFEIDGIDLQELLRLEDDDFE
jgi:hypothetical protein